MKAKVRHNTPAEEAAIQRGIAADPDNPEWTTEDFAKARPAKEVLPSALYAELTAPRRARRPGIKPANTLAGGPRFLPIVPRSLGEAKRNPRLGSRRAVADPAERESRGFRCAPPTLPETGAPIVAGRLTLRVDQDVIAALRASGRGWQARANEALRRLVKA